MSAGSSKPPFFPKTKTRCCAIRLHVCWLDRKSPSGASQNVRTSVELKYFARRAAPTGVFHSPGHRDPFAIHARGHTSFTGKGPRVCYRAALESAGKRGRAPCNVLSLAMFVTRSQFGDPRRPVHSYNTSRVERGLHEWSGRGRFSKCAPEPASKREVQGLPQHIIQAAVASPPVCVRRSHKPPNSGEKLKVRTVE